MRNLTFTSLNAANVSGDHNGSYGFIYQKAYASCQVIMTGSSPTGVVKLQASNDPFDPNASLGAQQPVNWTDITSATVSVSSNTTYLIPKIDVCYNWLRAVYTHTSGTGTVTANIVTLGG